MQRYNPGRKYKNFEYFCVMRDFVFSFFLLFFMLNFYSMGQYYFQIKKKTFRKKEKII